MKKAELLKRKSELETELKEVDGKLAVIELNAKPYEAVVYGYSNPGRSSMFFKTEEQARAKFTHYSGQRRYRNGAVYGTALYRNNEDGTKTLLDSVKRAEWWNLPKEDE